MYQMSTFETGGVIKSVSIAKRGVDGFHFELFHDSNNDNHPMGLQRPKNEYV